MKGGFGGGMMGKEGKREERTGGWNEKESLREERGKKRKCGWD